MPYLIKKVNNGFKVCKREQPSKCFSNKPLSKSTAVKQLKAIGISESGGSKPLDTNLYNKIKDSIYKQQPKHSLFRSARIVKEYKKAGGEYTDDIKPKMNIDKWFKQKWISLNDFLRNDIVKCGNSDTQTKFNEYPVCRPLSIAKKLSKSQIKDLIDEKNILKQKPLLTNKVLNTNRFNIKSTNTGSAKTSKFKNWLINNDIDPSVYLDFIKYLAKKNGYNPKLISFSLDPKKKLNYNGVDFGAYGYNDYIIYLYLELLGKLSKGTAFNKRNNYRKRAFSVYQKSDKFSPSALAFNLLW